MRSATFETGPKIALGRVHKKVQLRTVYRENNAYTDKDVDLMPFSTSTVS
jgi:hypothetical protein